MCPSSYESGHCTDTELGPTLLLPPNPSVDTTGIPYFTDEEMEP